MTAFPVFWQQSSAIRVANHIIDGDPFKPEALRAFELAINEAGNLRICSPAAIRGAAILRLRILEQAAVAGDRQALDIHIKLADRALRHSLACSPADSFLWLSLFSTQNHLNGFNSDQLKLLRMSYVLGPNEGWIGIKRNRLAFAIFEQLPSDLAAAALHEFVKLLRTGFYNESAATFIGPGWRNREIILSQLKDIPERHRRAFGAVLHRQGYDVAVPGIDRRDPRPWH